MSEEVVRLNVAARYRAVAGQVEVDRGQGTFQVTQRAPRHEADAAFCPIELVLAGLGA